MIQFLISAIITNTAHMPHTSVFISESRTARDTNSHFKIPNVLRSSSLQHKKKVESSTMNVTKQRSNSRWFYTMQRIVQDVLH